MKHFEPLPIEWCGATEIVMNDNIRVAWTGDNEVFVHIGDTSEREDGYTFVGLLSWEDTLEDDDANGEHNLSRLREFVTNWMLSRLSKFLTNWK